MVSASAATVIVMSGILICLFFQFRVGLSGQPNTNTEQAPAFDHDALLGGLER